MSMRLMGNRMGKPLTRNELLAIVSLAAANGVALMAADRGLLPVVLIAAIVIGYQRWRHGLRAMRGLRAWCSTT
jgi:uncharacterized membrane protein YcaP (DUF421 family)